MIQPCPNSTRCVNTDFGSFSSERYPWEGRDGNQPCPVAVKCPGDDFGNYTSECSDADYVADRTYCLFLGQTVSISFRSLGVGPFTWDIGDLPIGLGYQGGAGIAFGNPDVLIAFGNPDAPVQIAFGQPQAPTPESTCPGLIVIVGIAQVAGVFTTHVRVTDGYGNVTEADITFVISSNPAQDPLCGYVSPPPPVCPEGETCAQQVISVDFCDGTSQDFVIPSDPVAAQAVYDQIKQMSQTRWEYCNLHGQVPPPGNWLWFNTPQSATSTCPDGLSFTYTVPAGSVLGSSLQLANQGAYARALARANANKVCLGDLVPANACYNEDYSGSITMTGPAPAGAGQNFWSLTAGALPTGLTFNGGPIDHGLPVTITGTPTQSGTFTFTVRVDTPNGAYMEKQFTLCVIQISPATPISIPVNTPASIQLTADACAVAPLNWQVTLGHLPTGLSLDESTGLITGTPTIPGTFYFTVTLQTEAS